MRKVQTFLRADDEDDDGFEFEEGKPILPQIECYAKERGIELPTGWKVDIAKAFKRRMFGKKRISIPSDSMKMWVELFKKLGE